MFAQEEGNVSPDEHPTKKRRLLSKLSPSEIARKLVSWQTVMAFADRTALRVGTQIVDPGELDELVQKMCPQHNVHHVVLCGGTDRYTGQIQKLFPGSAPLRRRICISRRHEDVVVDEEWEPWEKLTFKGLRRKGVAARVSLMIFASAKHVVGQHSESSEAPETSRQVPDMSAEGHQRRPLENGSDSPEAKKARLMSPMMAPAPDTQAPMDEMDRQVIDLASQRHGPKFVALKPETQSWLLKVHRNMVSRNWPSFADN